MKLGIVGAIDKEVAHFMSNMENAVKTEYLMRSFSEGKLFGTDAVVVAGGIGKVNAAIAAQALISRFGATHVIVSGVAGGMEKTLHIGDTVIADEVCYHDTDEMLYTDHPKMDSPFFIADSKLNYALGKAAKSGAFNQDIRFGRVVTGDVFIEDDGRQEIIEKYNPLCVDMETAAIAHVCFVSGVPFAAVRSMSDTESERGVGTFEENCTSAAENSAKIVSAAIRLFSE